MKPMKKTMKPSPNAKVAAKKAAKQGMGYAC